MTIWSLILVVLAGVALAAGWRLRLNEPILISIGLSAGALLLLIVSMIRDRSAKRKKSGPQPSSALKGRPEGALRPAAAGYGAIASQPRVLPAPTARSGGDRGSRPFTEPHPAARSVKPLDFEHAVPAEVPDLARSLPAHEAPVEPEATVQILPPEGEEPPVLDAGGPADAETPAAETEIFQIEMTEESVVLEPVQEPVHERAAPGTWGFNYLPSSPEERFGEAEGEAATVPEAPSAPGEPSDPEDARRAGGRPLPSKKKELPRRKAPGKLVYWWEGPGQGSARAAGTSGRAGTPPASKPKRARPADSSKGSSHPAPRASDDVPAIPAERTKSPEITIRLVPTPKKRTKAEGKRTRAKPANGTGARPAANTNAPPAMKAPQATATDKPVPAARTRPAMVTKPATKLRATAKAKPARRADSDDSKASATSPREEEPFKYLG